MNIVQDSVSEFVYSEKEKAEDDLISFSNMYANEEKVLCVVGNAVGYSVVRASEIHKRKVHSFALNGIIFTPLN